MSKKMKNVSKLSHIALVVSDIEKMIDFYQYFAEMSLIHRRIDEEVNVAWLKLGAPSELTIVMIENKNLNETGYQRMNHFGFDCTSKEAVDNISVKAKNYNCIKYNPFCGGEILGYLCVIEDPDGNQLEFAYGQMRTD